MHANVHLSVSKSCIGLVARLCAFEGNLLAGHRLPPGRHSRSVTRSLPPLAASRIGRGCRHARMSVMGLCVTRSCMNVRCRRLYDAHAILHVSNACGNDSTIRRIAFVPDRGNRARSMSREALAWSTMRNNDSDGEEWSWRISNDGAGPRDRTTLDDDDSGDEEDWMPTSLPAPGAFCFRTTRTHARGSNRQPAAVC